MSYIVCGSDAARILSAQLQHKPRYTKQNNGAESTDELLKELTELVQNEIFEDTAKNYFN